MNKDLIFLTKMLTLEFSDFAVFHCLKTTTTTTTTTTTAAAATTTTTQQHKQQKQ